MTVLDAIGNTPLVEIRRALHTMETDGDRSCAECPP
jgi:hypothetical protein